MRVGVLASGAGTNLQAILDRLRAPAGLDDPADRTAPTPPRRLRAPEPTAIEVVAVGSDQPQAEALARARRAAVPTQVFPRAAYPDRAARDAAIADWLSERRVELVVLAGYMQLLSPSFLARYPDRVVNVHPALLPAFAGIDAVGQALAYGVKVFGVTVHFVDDGVDSGRIILQRAVALPEATEPETVRAALRPVEHDLLCEAITLIAHGAVRLDPDHPRRVLVVPA